MATVIDELVVILGLDPKNFTKGQREAIASLKQTREAAETQAKGIEHAGGRMATAFGILRGGLAGIAGGLVGGLSAHAFVEILKHVTRTGVEMGRTARATGISSQQLATWRNLAERTGGTAEGMTTSIRGMAGEFQKIEAGMQSDLPGILNQMGVKYHDIVKDGVITDLDEFNRRIADGLKNIKDRFGTGKGFQWASFLGMDDATADLFMRGGVEMERMRKESDRLVHSTKKHTDENAKLLDTYTRLKTQIATPIEEGLTEYVSPWVRKAMDLWILKIQSLQGSPADQAKAQGEFDKLRTELTDQALKWIKRTFDFSKFNKPQEAFDELGDLIFKMIREQVLPWFKSLKIFPDRHGNLRSFDESPDPATSTGPSPLANPTGWWRKDADLPVKPGSGVISSDARRLAEKITSEIPGVNRFTSFNDAHHRGRGPHGRGQALDFTVNDPAQAAAIAKQVEEKMAAAGMRVRVTNEYDPAKRSAAWTAPHIHVELLPRPGQRRSEVTDTQPLGSPSGWWRGGPDTAMTTVQRPAPGGFPVGAPQMAAARASENQTTTTTTTENVNVNTLNVVTQATDAVGIARSIRGALSTRNAIERVGLANQANSGLDG